MPNRILRESICSSESISSLSWFEEVFFYRLMVNCDDFGRFDARVPVLRKSLFLLEDVTDAQIEKALEKLASLGMVATYMVENKAYLIMTAWDKYQSRRASKSKYPDPPETLQASASRCKQVQASASRCKQVQADVPEESRNRGIDTRGVEESIFSPEPSADDSGPVAIELLTNKENESVPITEKQVSEFEQSYPAVDVRQQLNSMRSWLVCNPAKRKTKGGMLRFVNNWLSREQDKGKPAQSARSSPAARQAPLPADNFDWKARDDDFDPAALARECMNRMFADEEQTT